MDSDQRTKEFLGYLSQNEPKLRAFVLAMVPRWTEAQDIIQEVQLRLWEQFDEFDRSRDFGAWARTIAYYFVLTLRKRETRQRAKLSDQVLEQVTVKAADVLAQSDARHFALLKCLEKLHQSKREMVVRYYAGKETLRELAAALGRSFDSVRQIVLRTRKRLAECVAETLRQEDQA